VAEFQTVTPLRLFTLGDEDESAGSLPVLRPVDTAWHPEGGFSTALRFKDYRDSILPQLEKHRHGPGRNNSFQKKTDRRRPAPGDVDHKFQTFRV
jgi:hypothetical protein